MQEELGIERLDELCPPTGPAVSRQKHFRNGREWVYTQSSKVELDELLDRFQGTNSLHGHRVTFTGTMETAQRSIMQELVTRLGGVCEKSTTKKTTILVMGIPNPASWKEGATGSRKLQKATKLREAGSPITVMSEKDFLNFLHDGQN
ncbi:BRCT domain-containing protein [Schaalia sp. ZJ405]|uniref:BRCT domain-containing protein n=2 Tax=unclassified Schaalia TaxID=2691889 RepID=UPI001E622032|nr:BRCT domain-containing protein [Schaalia sp. ZJ405]